MRYHTPFRATEPTRLHPSRRSRSGLDFEQYVTPRQFSWPQAKHSAPPIQQSAVSREKENLEARAREFEKAQPPATLPPRGVLRTLIVAN